MIKELKGDNAPILVYATFPTLDSADEVGQELVSRKLVACVNILPGMISHYSWQQKLHRDEEVVVLAKTRAGNVDDVFAFMKSHHSYDVPALVAVNIVAGDQDYLRWVAEQSTRPSG